MRFWIFPNDRYNFLQIVGKFPKMVPLLLPNFGSSLKWYQFCLWFFILFSNSTFFVAKLCRFPKWYLYSGDFFVKIEATFSQILVPFLRYVPGIPTGLESPLDGIPTGRNPHWTEFHVSSGHWQYPRSPYLGAADQYADQWHGIPTARLTLRLHLL